ncbi:MAG: hypothetical protein IPN76_00125 [Saprospiraceae bacterium]|nr:hypothetical protein [Saprospiraceae bacterium]
MVNPTAYEVLNAHDLPIGSPARSATGTANPATMMPLCANACVVCDINGFTGINNSGTTGEVPPGFCTTTAHNSQWIAFQAASTSLTLYFSVFNCQSGGVGSQTGLEVGIYYSLDCETFQLVSNCDGDFPPNTT